jgi:hypothetical protein
MTLAREMGFSLLTDDWIPVVQQRGLPESLCSIKWLLTNAGSVHTLGGNPFLWTAVFRLLAALKIDGSLLNTAPWELNQNPFLREFDCPEKSAKPASIFLGLMDGNSVAWNCLAHMREGDSLETIAQALIQTYFSDRFGLKAQVAGFSVSGSSPPHIGKTSILRYGETVEELLERNVDPAWGQAEYEFLMHPWRQIKIIGDRMIVAANKPYDGEIIDPWAKDSGRMKYIRKAPLALTKDLDAGKFINITFWLNQAKVLACDISTFTKEAETNG